MDRHTHVAREGLAAGAIGFATTAVLMVVVDFIGGQPVMYTPALLGRTLFDWGADSTSVTTVGLTPALAYAGAHLAVFFAIGLLGAWLARMAERGNQLWFVGLFVFIFVNFHIIGMAGLLQLRADAAIAGGRGWVIGIASGLGMAAYILRMHPNVRRMMRRWEE